MGACPRLVSGPFLHGERAPVHRSFTTSTLNLIRTDLGFVLVVRDEEVVRAGIRHGPNRNHDPGTPKSRSLARDGEPSVGDRFGNYLEVGRDDTGTDAPDAYRTGSQRSCHFIPVPVEVPRQYSESHPIQGPYRYGVTNSGSPYLPDRVSTVSPCPVGGDWVGKH